MTKFIKIYGERNTNTNYMSKLLELNLDVLEVPGTVPPFIFKIQKILPGKELVRDIYFFLTYDKNLGWKHTCVKSSQDLKKYKLANSKLAFITITKNPYSWLMSLYNRPYHQYRDESQSFEEFLQCKWNTIGRDNIKTKVLANPIELWNIKNRSYIDLDRKNTTSVTTEEIFRNPEKVIQKISERHSIERKPGGFINYERSTKDKSKDFAYYRDYYLLEKWRQILSKKAIAIINETVDKELMTNFGYYILPDK